MLSECNFKKIKAVILCVTYHYNKVNF